MTDFAWVYREGESKKAKKEKMTLHWAGSMHLSGGQRRGKAFLPRKVW